MIVIVVAVSFDFTNGSRNGNLVGIVVLTTLAAAALAAVWLQSRGKPVNADNVNDVVDEHVVEPDRQLVGASQA